MGAGRRNIVKGNVTDLKRAYTFKNKLKTAFFFTNNCVLECFFSNDGRTYFVVFLPLNSNIMKSTR